MCFFKRKSKTQKLENNVNEIKALAAKVDNLLPLCESDEIKEKVNKIKEEISYLKTSVSAEAGKLQNKIENLIDEYLGYHHVISCDVEIPQVKYDNKTPCGRINLSEREANVRKHDFDAIECSMTKQEAAQEANRCLRCDHFGYGNLKGGRAAIW